MKKQNLKSLSMIGALAIALLPATNALALVSPSSVKVKVYEFLVSTDKYCSNPISIYKTATPTAIDFMAAPAIGSGSLANGTYPCIIMVLSDDVSFTPATSSGSCVAGTPVSLNIQPAGTSDQLPDGTTSTSVAGQDNKFPVYFSTASTSGGQTQGNPSQPPSAANTNLGVPLSGALVVSGNQTNTFVFGAANTLDGSQATCMMSRPTFGFR